MCDTVDIVNGPQISTPQEFKEWFDIEPLPGSDAQISTSMSYPCLCGSNVDLTLQGLGMAYLYDGMGYIVGDVEYLKKRVDKFTVRSYFP